MVYEIVRDGVRDLYHAPDDTAALNVAARRYSPWAWAVIRRSDSSGASVYVWSGYAEELKLRLTGAWWGPAG